MKRILVICVALIAFMATNASGTNYQPTDQLQTHLIAWHPQTDFNFVAVNFEPAQAVVDYGYVAKLAVNNDVLLSIKPDAYTLIDPGRKSLLRACNQYLSNGLEKNKPPILGLTIKRLNYNINFSYGLRY